MAAAPVPGAKPQGMALAGCNYVGQDEIWKAHVHQEVNAAKKWPVNWDFMTTKYDELVKDDFPRQARQKLLPPTPVRLPPITPIEKRVTVLPSNRPVPSTSNSMIGWRSADPRLSLEVYGGYAKPKGGLVKQLNWPTEAID